MKSLVVFFSLVLCSCTKNPPLEPGTNNTNIPVEEKDSSFVVYQIFKGNHYCDKTSIDKFNGSKICFAVKFDSSAIYQSANPANQADINKLYGFTEDINNHLNSARIGWNWINHSLHLYAYAYANGIRSFKAIKPIKIGETVTCSISVIDSIYCFKVADSSFTLKRSCTTKQVNGYKQFPYFGGDEIAPHDIKISIREI